MSDSMLEMHHIWVKFTPSKRPEVVAVEDASITVQENEFVSLIGPSGCGKSTLLRAGSWIGNSIQRRDQCTGPTC